MKHYSGIDLGNKKTAICVISENREVVLEKEVATDGEEITKVLSGFKNLTCIVESAPLAEWLCKVVSDSGHEISIVCARKAKKVLSASGKKKTDKRDAQSLAELCRSGWYEAVHRKSEQAREHRTYLMARKTLVEESTKLRVTIRGLLKANGIRLTAEGAEFSEQVRKTIESLPELVREAIDSLLVMYEQVSQQQKRMYRQLDKLSEQEEVTKLLETVPSVGPSTAIGFFCTIDNPHRFRTAEQVVSYIGLNSSVYQSGETEYRGRISKEGDHLLRSLLVEAAHNLLSLNKCDCALKRWGLKLQEKKGGGKARVAVARKLAIIMWQMWRKQEPFRNSPAAA
jgi:transposase